MMARLALSLAYFPAHRERRRALADRALAMARRIGEPAALAEALAANHEATWGPDNVEERLAMTRELAGRAAELGDGALAATAHVRSAAALLELADFDASRGELRQLTRLAEALRQSYPRWFVAVARATRAFLEGRLEKCEALAHVAATVGRGWNEDTAMGLRALQLSYVRSEQGRHEEAVEWAERMAEHFPELPAARASLALVYAQAERHAAAREELELLAGGDFADLPRDAMWLPGIHALCQIAALLGDVRRAQRLYTLLLPYAERCVVITSVHCLGSAARPLGLVATTLSRFDNAARHFETALAINARIQSPLWIAHTQHDYAQALLRRCEPGDREHALHLLGTALATTDKLGLNALADTARRLKRQADAAAIRLRHSRKTRDTRTASRLVLSPHASPIGRPAPAAARTQQQSFPPSTAWTARLVEKQQPPSR
jgi:tetratricopeptide (TPR) repeat protein